MKPCCTDHKGKLKKKYLSIEEAEKVAQLRRDDGIGINVYPCEERNGWHLTSQNAPLPQRPKNVMTQEDRRLYSRRNKNRLGDLIDGEVVRQLKDEVRKNTLLSLEKKIGRLEQDIEEKVKAYKIRRKELTILRNDLETAKEELNLSKRHLLTAKHENELAKKRIKRKSL